MHLQIQMVCSCTRNREIHEELPNIHTELKTKRFLILGGEKGKEGKMERRVRQKYQFIVSAEGTERKNDMYVVAFDKGYEMDKLLSIYQQFLYIYLVREHFKFCTCIWYKAFWIFLIVGGVFLAFSYYAQIKRLWFYNCYHHSESCFLTFQ